MSGTRGRPEDVAHLRDVDLLRDDVRDLARHLHDIDTLGTRGAGVIEQKLLELTGDFAELRAEFRNEREKREAEAVRAAQARSARRKWLIGAAFTAAGFLITTLTFLYDVLQHVSHP